MARLTASRRLSIMSGALAYAEDRAAAGTGPVHLDDVARELEESVEDVRESLEPLVWVEMEVPGGIVDLLDAVRLDDDTLVVEEGWWRRLAALTPGEAARLYTKAAAAASLDAVGSRHLASAMAKLRRMVAEVTVVEGEVPPNVARLRAARDEGHDVLVNIEGHDRTVVTSNATFSVVAVFRSGNEWMVTLGSVSGNIELGLSDGDVVTVPVRRILGVLRAGSTVSKDVDVTPSIIDPESAVEVTVEYPKRSDWVLDPFAPQDVSELADDRRRATVRVWGTAELKTLMLRLGPNSRVIAPDSLADVRSKAAAEILRLYES